MPSACWTSSYGSYRGLCSEAVGPYRERTRRRMQELSTNGLTLVGGLNASSGLMRNSPHSGLKPRNYLEGARARRRVTWLDSPFQAGSASAPRAASFPLGRHNLALTSAPPFPPSAPRN